jgi:WD40 repeat protein
MCFSPDSKRLAGTMRDGTVKVWDIVMRRQASLLKGHTDRICCLSFSPDGRRLVLGSGIWDAKSRSFTSGEVKVWDAQTGK